ncbi:hypothetical protein [Amycolatopsis cihanbeyliensis]|uniref:Uncharacterized protein n=1 Tax=Amycolatopsis cihanbeyliensis TaxID=1128664 RepID=A0A542DIS9_AMYCI|nr:hypothetical protein [Amycolatopsis cihanbeyliensis]TQJ02998.1 hypothetical protein FB471_2748 [Amycolatopsis cihanbeyliensis]
MTSKTPKRQSWSISGCYATWRLTIAIDPPEYEDGDPDTLDWPEEKIRPLVDHFGQVVDYCEIAREFERGGVFSGR